MLVTLHKYLNKIRTKIFFVVARAENSELSEDKSIQITYDTSNYMY